MADDKSRRDTSRVAANENYEVEYTKQQTLELIEKHGNDRATLNAEAAKLKAGR